METQPWTSLLQSQAPHHSAFQRRKALLFPIWAAFVGGPGLVTCISEPPFPCCPMSLNPKVLKMSSSSKTLIY